MSKIVLAPEDRERFGCAEELPWKLALSVDEAIELQDRTGIAWTDFAKALKRLDPRAVKAAVWMALNRAGHQIGWDDTKFDLTAVVVLENPPSLGKDPSSTPPPDSEPDETS